MKKAKATRPPPDEIMVERVRRLAQRIADGVSLETAQERGWLMFCLGAVHGAVLERNALQLRELRANWERVTAEAAELRAQLAERVIAKVDRTNKRPRRRAPAHKRRK